MSHRPVLEAFAATVFELGASARKLVAQVRGWGSTGSDDAAEPVDRVGIAQPYGLFARPTPADRGTDAMQVIGVRVGNQIIGLCVLDHGRAPHDPAPEAGEVDLYNEAVRLRLMPDGTIRLGATAVKLLVLDGDGVNATGVALPPAGMAGWMAQVTAACNSAIGGSVTVPPPTQIGTVGSSATKAKGE